MYVRKLYDLVEIASGKGCKKLVVAVAQDDNVLGAVKSAIQAGIVLPILIGDKVEIKAAAKTAGFDLSGAEIIHEPDKRLACILSVRLIKENQAQILMKGIVSTGVLLKAVLDKDQGLMKSSLLSHVAVFESPYYHKLIGITDAALNVNPDFTEKVTIVNNAVDVFHRLEIQVPKVAVLAAVETVNPKMEATVHAAMLAVMQKRNQIEGCLLDGPLALDNAISIEAARHKGIVSDVAGDSDILVTPDLNSGNILYKSFSFLGGALGAAIVVGATVPIVLTSRADPEKSKFLSIALAASLL
jgi:phosphate butyryltransferase